MIISSHSSWSFTKYPQPGVQLQVLCRGHHYQLLHIRTVSQVPCETVDYPGYLKCWINQCKSWCLWLGFDCHWYGLFIVVPDNDIRYYSLKRTLIWSPLKTMMMWSVNEVLRRRGQILALNAYNIFFLGFSQDFLKCISHVWRSHTLSHVDSERVDTFATSLLQIAFLAPHIQFYNPFQGNRNCWQHRI